MHQGSDAVQTGLLKLETGLQRFEAHAVADMTESRFIEVEAQRIGRTVLWSVQPEDLSVRVNEAAD
ncbi:hypothetical protein D9M71_406950 [compost metagenome]